MTNDSGSINELLTVDDVAEFLKISVPSVRRLQQKRLIPFYKVGGGIRFSMSDLLSYLESNRVDSLVRI